jgi:hypothetical protein
MMMMILAQKREKRQAFTPISTKHNVILMYNSIVVHYMNILFQAPRALFEIKVFKFIFLSIATVKRVSCFNQKAFLTGKTSREMERKVVLFMSPSHFRFWEHLSANMIFRKKRTERLPEIFNDNGWFMFHESLNPFSFNMTMSF